MLDDDDDDDIYVHICICMYTYIARYFGGLDCLRRFGNISFNADNNVKYTQARPSKAYLTQAAQNIHVLNHVSSYAWEVCLGTPNAPDPSWNFIYPPSQSNPKTLHAGIRWSQPYTVPCYEMCRLISADKILVRFLNLRNMLKILT